MFRRKKRKDSRRGGSRRTPAITGAQCTRAATITASVLIFGAAGMLAAVKLPRVQASLAKRIAASPATVEIQWPMSPGAEVSWLPAEEQDQILSAAHAQLERLSDPLSSEALAAVAQTLEATGWFEEIRRIERGPGNTVKIDAAWRTPAAVVRKNGVDYLISRKGELLRIAYQPERAPLPAIVGAAFDPPSVNGQMAYGRTWPGADVQAALEVLALVNRRPWRHQVAAVDVSEYLGGRRICLNTQWNSRVVWGGAPSDSVPGEVSAELKVLRLDVLHKQFQRIDARQRIVEVAGPMTLVDDTASASAS